jgi:hypothetical protein
MSEDSALKRIQAARILRQFPAMLEAVADGRLHLTGVCLLAPHLNPGNADQLMAAAVGKSKAEIKQLLAELYPGSEELPLVETLHVGALELPGEHAPAHVEGGQRLEVPTTRPSVRPIEALPPRTKMAPIAHHRFALHLTLGQDTHDKLRHAQSLLSHRIESGDLVAVLDRVLDLAIERLEQRKHGGRQKRRMARKRAMDSRHIAAHVRQAVWERDGGHCTFVGTNGRRCPARDHLEFDHAVPFARGGEATAANLRLRCRAHNQYEAERVFGVDFMRRKRRDASDRRRGSNRSQEEARARAAEIVPGLRHLGFSAEESRQAAEFCARMSSASLEERFRAALSYLSPKRGPVAMVSPSSGP